MDVTNYNKLIQTDLVSRYADNASFPSSHPKPLSLYPPKGEAG